MKWIEVEKELPQDGTQALVCKDLYSSNPKIAADYMVYRVDIMPLNPQQEKHYSWGSQLEGKKSDITHWMKLPKFPLKTKAKTRKKKNSEDN